MNQACYDLAHNPPTFDAVAFIVQVVEQFGTEPVAINIAHGPVEGFRNDNVWPQSIGKRERLYAQILVPLFQMLPSVRIIRHDSREGWGKNEYTIPWKHFVRCNSKGIRPLQPRAHVPTDPRLVTITLREADHWPQRNSNVPEWLLAARVIREMGYRVVFIRDTKFATDSFDEFPVSWRAATDLHARGALYRAATCNMFVSNGPAWLAMACDAPTLVFRPTCEDLGSCYDSNWFRECGVEPGGQFPNTAKHHRLIWAADTRDTIISAFEDFIA